MADLGVLLSASAVVVGLYAGAPSSVPTSDPANCERSAPETAATAHTSPSLDDFGRVDAAVTGADGVTYALCVLVADTPELQGRGLMEVADVAELDGADGMVFVWDEPVTARFYMWQTPLPLTLAFFDASGAWIGGDDMDPCVGDDVAACERFSSPAPYCVGLEVPQGTFEGVFGPGASLTLDDIGDVAATAPPPSAPATCDL